MEAVRVETVVQANGTVTIDNLPFSTGEKVEVIVLANASVKTAGDPLKGSPAVYLQDPFEPAWTEGEASHYPFRRTPCTYIDPFEPAVPPEDWEALK